LGWVSFDFDVSPEAIVGEALVAVILVTIDLA
jgi:hypothetical protein